ncbi:MAG: PEP-CTERM system histidine kinase PrsK, partial [Verrucomicrobiota bacterium]|nr:PEP-CTERM system histidine kinase PrsK [Verrucomicrobiota bacterium]
MTVLALWSYGAAAAAFAGLGLLLAVSWRGRLAGALLIAAAIVNACWAAAVAAGGDHATIGHSLSSTLELVRTGIWFAFFASLLAVRTRNRQKRYRVPSPGIFWIGALLLFAGLVVQVFGNEWPVHRSATAYFGIRVVLAIVGLMLVEQLYRNVPQDSRWTIKFLCLGVGALFGYDLVLYADAMLFRFQDHDLWTGRGIANALVVPLIAVSAARNPAWSLDVAVSRRVVFQSTALVGAAAYLLVVAAAGYYIRFFGGSWGGVLQTVVLFSGLIGLLLLALSGTLRAQLKLFVSKNFFSYRYDYREEWLRITRDLSASAPDEDFGQRSIRALANLVESPGGALWLKQDNDSYERVAQWNAFSLIGVEPVDGALATFLAAGPSVVNLEEYRSSPSRYAALDVPCWLLSAAEAWLVVPLIFQEKLLGFLVLLSGRVRLAIDWEVDDLLKTAGRQVAGYLAQLQASQALLVARQFESFNRMSAFVVHDLKNLVAQLSLLVSNASRHSTNPAFQQDMVATVQNASEKMKRLLSQLRADATPVEQPVALDVAEVVRDAVAGKSALKPTPAVEVDQAQIRTIAHRERLERVIGHLVQNAAEATRNGGEIRVRVKENSESAIIEVEDTGVGMTSDFLHTRLF